MTAVDVARDEMTPLRTRLQNGDWRALCEPANEALLPLLLIDAADWWPKAVDLLAQRLTQSALGHGLAMIFDSQDEEAKRLVGWWGLELNESKAAQLMLRVAGRTVGRSENRAEHRAVLAILERYTP